MLALGVAVLSLLVAGITFFFEDFEGPDISVVAGPTFKLYYDDFAPTASGRGGTGFFLPVTFVNSGARTGTVLQTLLAVYRADTPRETFLMRWAGFAQSVPRKLDLQAADIPQALTLPPRSGATRIVWFYWDSSSTPPLVFGPGIYTMRLLVVEAGQKEPKRFECDFTISAEDATLLAARRSTRDNSYFDVAFGEQFASNELLTRERLDRLSGISGNLQDCRRRAAS